MKRINYIDPEMLDIASPPLPRRMIPIQNNCNENYASSVLR
jgi:hypothetical protein